MSPTEYQFLAARTLNPCHAPLQDSERQILNYAIGMAGEIGEVLEIIKKNIFHGHDLDAAKLEAELGDILWYISAMATLHGLNLEDVMIGNIERLRRRYPQGFSSDDSINREDE